ncbi:MAG: alpha/beta hydrolase [Bacteroidales bacterium]|nr:alpha/beta hydrolase [Bacteroidales bacterium]
MKNLALLIALIISTPLFAKYNYFVKEYEYNIKQNQAYEDEVYLISTRNITNISEIDKFRRGFYNRPVSTPQFYKAFKYNDTINYVEVNGVGDFDKLTTDHRDILLYAPGHGKTFNDNVLRARDLSSLYNLTVIIFDWPTNNVFLSKTDRNSRLVHDTYLDAIHQLKQHIQSNRPDKKVNLLFHSMGNEVFKSVSRDEFFGQIAEGFIDNIVLNAPAVHYRGHVKWLNEINVNSDIYIIMNDNDKILQAASLLRLGRLLGATPKSALISEKANYVDLTLLVEKEHSYFYGSTQPEKKHPEIFKFYNTLFHGIEPSIARYHVFKKEKKLYYGDVSEVVQ